MAAAVTIDPHALITADDVKEFYGRAAQQDLDQITRAINGVTQMFEAICDRKFKARKHWNQIFNHVDELILKNIPVHSVDSIYDAWDVVTASGTADSGTTTTLVDNALTQADYYWNGALLSVRTAAASATAAPTWEQKRVDDFVASTDTASVAANEAFSTAVASGMAYRLMQHVPIGAALIDTDYEYQDLEAGLIRLNGKASRLLVTYTGGFGIIPNDLKIAAIKMSEWMLREGKSAGLALEQFRNVQSQGKGEAPDSIIRDIHSVLMNYKRTQIYGF